MKTKSRSLEHVLSTQYMLAISSITVIIIVMIMVIVSLLNINVSAINNFLIRQVCYL